MSSQYAFCPNCGIRRIAHGYRCSVCDGLVRRAPVQAHLEPAATRTLLSWPAHEAAEAAPAEAAPAERQPVAA